MVLRTINVLMQLVEKKRLILPEVGASFISFDQSSRSLPQFIRGSHTEITTTSAITREDQSWKIAWKRGKQYKDGYLLVISKITKQIIFLLNRHKIAFQQNTSVCFLKTGERNLYGIFFHGICHFDHSSIGIC